MNCIGENSRLDVLEPMEYMAGWPTQDRPAKARHHVIEVCVKEEIPWINALYKTRAEISEDVMSSMLWPASTEGSVQKQVLIIGVIDCQVRNLLAWAKEHHLVLSSPRTLLAIAEQFPQLPQKIYGDWWTKHPTSLLLGGYYPEEGKTLGVKWEAVYEKQPGGDETGYWWSTTKCDLSVFFYRLEMRDAVAQHQWIVFESR